MNTSGVTLIEPKRPSKSAQRFLQLRIPRFVTPEANFQEIAASLLIDIRGVLVPNEGTAGEVLSSPDAPKSGPIEMQDATVEQILNRIAQQGRKAAWVLLPLPKDYRAAANRQFIRIVGYPDVESRIERLSCKP